MKRVYRIVHDGSSLYPYRVEYKSFLFWHTLYDMPDYMFRTPAHAEHELKRYLDNLPPKPHVVKYIVDL